jgi:hypothetical protein
MTHQRFPRLGAFALALAAPLVLAGCIGQVTAPELAAPTPRFDALAFFEGESTGLGTLDKIVGKTATTRVSSTGSRQPDGSLRLVQRVTEGAKPQRTRSWVIRETMPGQYEGKLTDATGPVTGESNGNRLHLAYRMKGGFDVDQWLYLEPGGRVAQNHMKVSKLGVAVARLDETIRKQ